VFKNNGRREIEMKSCRLFATEYSMNADLHTIKKISSLRSSSRGREIRTPMSGFGDRHTAIV
jgi:hypothetical protein